MTHQVTSPVTSSCPVPGGGDTKASPGHSPGQGAFRAWIQLGDKGPQNPPRLVQFWAGLTLVVGLLAPGMPVWPQCPEL